MKKRTLDGILGHYGGIFQIIDDYRCVLEQLKEHGAITNEELPGYVHDKAKNIDRMLRRLVQLLEEPTDQGSMAGPVRNFPFCSDLDGAISEEDRETLHAIIKRSVENVSITSY